MKFISDKYRKTRGGRSRMLVLSCESCGSFLFEYQKDGPGPLKRIYLDRIKKSVRPTKNITCPKCKSVLGTYYLYPKEKRPAFRLYQNSIVKKAAK